MAISMLKIRRPSGRLIFNTGIVIPGKTVFLIETAPWKTSYEDCLVQQYVYVLKYDSSNIDENKQMQSISQLF